MMMVPPSILGFPFQASGIRSARPRPNVERSVQRASYRFTQPQPWRLIAFLCRVTRLVTPRQEFLEFLAGQDRSRW